MMKTCKHQGHKQSDTCVTCKLDGSRRLLENCVKGKCAKWQQTRLEHLLWAWNYGPMNGESMWLILLALVCLLSAFIGIVGAIATCNAAWLMLWLPSVLAATVLIGAGR